jgi:hypothetical protein
MGTRLEYGINGAIGVLTQEIRETYGVLTPEELEAICKLKELCRRIERIHEARKELDDLLERIEKC